MEIGRLPFDRNIGYPQKQSVKIGGRAYLLFYRWNVKGFAVLRIRDIESNEILFEGKLVEKKLFEIRDTKTYETLFVILPWKVTESDCEVWAFW
ncbi:MULTISPECIES: hypothetical protein [unclassified Archaeoglobus]|jgi:hypothetical protein|uniref:hypothetical protein n=1 Tax=unclassified Archaeoglobus TaxID=2643606 RepID=UPI0025B82153|nr:MULTISPECIES: hypothetical protein [unclassified Archaeoglobus]